MSEIQPKQTLADIEKQLEELGGLIAAKDSEILAFEASLSDGTLAKKQLKEVIRQTGALRNERADLVAAQEGYIRRARQVRDEIFNAEKRKASMRLEELAAKYQAALQLVIQDLHSLWIHARSLWVIGTEAAYFNRRYDVSNTAYYRSSAVGNTLLEQYAHSSLVFFEKRTPEAFRACDVPSQAARRALDNKPNISKANWA